MWGEEVYGEFLYVPVKFYCKPKTAFKKEKGLQKKTLTLRTDIFGKTFFIFMYYICVCVFAGLWYKIL